MKRDEQVYPVYFTGHRTTRVVALTQKLEDGSEQTIVLTLKQLERIARQVAEQMKGVRA